MYIKKLSLLVLAAVVLLTSTGFKLKRKAFSPEKVFAVVTIATNPKITLDIGSGRSSRMFWGMNWKTKIVRGINKRVGFVKGAKELLDLTKPIIIEEFSRSNSYRLMSEEGVFLSTAYAKADPDRRKNYVLANGYKYFKHVKRRTERKMKRLVRKMGLDGIIIIHIDYKLTLRNADAEKAAKPVSGVGQGIQHGMAIMSVIAYNRKGNVVWKDTVWGVSTSGVSTDGGLAKFEQLRPHFIEATRIAARKLVSSLDKKVQR